jgi:hypothetical protein
VGVQTGFGSASADRRAALRSTWFPSDPDGLVRSEIADLVTSMSLLFCRIPCLICAYIACANIEIIVQFFHKFELEEAILH